MGPFAGLGGCHQTEDFTVHVRGGQSDGVTGAGLRGDKVVLDVKLRIPGRDFYVWRNLRVPYEFADALCTLR